MVAPISGRVGLRPVDAGNYVSTGSTAGVAVITQLSPIDVAFSVPQDRVPEIQQRLHDMVVTIAPTSPQEFAQFIRAEKERWAKVIAAAGIPKE